ncbi:MAG: hypothetical protein EAY81_02305 [Bacteroidetes bacterium]|nr:MAG: hypothetical protein EAY81_02305 [Bacteroidota bacterium]
MSNGESKVCENCKSEFVCNPQNISHCGCSAIILSPAARQFIRQNYDDCVCPNCLLGINVKFNYANNANNHEQP